MRQQTVVGIVGASKSFRHGLSNELCQILLTRNVWARVAHPTSGFDGYCKLLYDMNCCRYDYQDVLIIDVVPQEYPEDEIFGSAGAFGQERSCDLYIVPEWAGSVRDVPDGLSDCSQVVRLGCMGDLVAFVDGMLRNEDVVVVS